MRARGQESTSREEEEHPYELLLTAETKKLPAVDGKTKGTTPHTPPAETALKGFIQFVPWIEGSDAVPCSLDRGL